jgi:hypothetical protein
MVDYLNFVRVGDQVDDGRQGAADEHSYQQTEKHSGEGAKLFLGREDIQQENKHSYAKSAADYRPETIGIDFFRNLLIACGEEENREQNDAENGPKDPNQHGFEPPKKNIIAVSFCNS